ncbi:hypothetical protein HS048_36400 [Planomonospora sp. ID91781]|uniref:hypothetical protein n=1 Tax=Planomonospora sp. ID91781 TaxID=2738135 RepID=UPI0018C44CBF|nr:hypothetical protein [Planomonospora sp. ID91781]MBG0826150.1 hypothetical protein [Planomonospora sp. ID91781]
MFGISLGRDTRPDDDGGGPVNGHAHGERSPLTPWSNDAGVREIRHYKVNPRQDKKHDRLPGRLLGVAGVVIFAALIGAGIVAYEAQRLFALAHNHAPGAAVTAADQWRAVVIAALPDAGWIAMALVALVAALRGQSSLRARVGVLIFFGLSLGAQVLYAPPTLQGLLVAVIPPITMAWMLETFVVEVRRWAGARNGLELDESPILTGALLALARLLRALLGLVMWLVRLAVSPRSTAKGLHAWILDTAPIAPGQTLASIRAAEAAERAAGAETTAEQVRAQAAEQVQAIEAAAAAELQQMAQRLAEVEREAREQVRAREVAAAAEREQMTRRLAEVERAAREEERQRARAQAEALRYEVERLGEELTHERQSRAALAELAEAKSGRERLITLYERLGAEGDPRYGDLTRASEVARELYQRAGLHSEGTARNYLYEHLKAEKSRELSPAGAMIEGSGS